VANYNDRVRVMVLNATFNNISAISWLPVLLVDETGLSSKTTDLQQVTDKFHHIMYPRIHHLSGIRTHNVSGVGTDCTGSCKSNYHTTMTVPLVVSLVHKKKKSIELTTHL